MASPSKTLIFPAVLIGLLATYLFLDGVFVYLSIAQLAIYAGFALTAALVAVVALMQRRVERRFALGVLFWVAVISAWLVPTLTTDFPYPRYIITDYLALLVPVFLFLVGLQFPRFFESNRALCVLGVAMLLAAMLAAAMPTPSGRHEPPHVLLSAMAWAVVFFGPTRALRSSALALVAVLFVLAWSSGERTAVILLLGLGIAGRVALMDSSRMVILTIAGVFATVAATGVVFKDQLVLAAASTRLESLAQGELDSSLLNRILEVRDVWSQWSLDVWYGFGHGATFAPEVSYPPRNMTDHGRVHHVHFGPALLLFRYGIVGVALYLWSVFDVARSLLRTNSGNPAAAQSFFFALAMAGYLIAFLAFNIIPDPAFSFTLAGYLYYRFAQPTPIAGTMNVPGRTLSATGA
ncbi:MAG: hypothetical protein AAF351_12330 [Pseudomonadota bacterium]